MVLLVISPITAYLSERTEQLPFLTVNSKPGVILMSGKDEGLSLGWLA
jgi:hypothetical protein